MTGAIPVIVVMGVSGSGKSTVGLCLAESLSVPFIDADDLHPKENVAKMRAGVSLDDSDRAPWLDRVAGAIEASDQGLVVACSALRRRYRDRLREASPDLWFVHLDGTRDVLRARMRSRRDHFMPATLLDSQLDALEPLEEGEAGGRFDIAESPFDLTARILRAR